MVLPRLDHISLSSTPPPINNLLLSFLLLPSFVNLINQSIKQHIHSLIDRRQLLRQMGVGLMASKQCDSCKSSPATLFCRADSAFLCSSCDSLIHSANKLASRHPRFFLCDVCEHSPATVSCKADAAHLCSSCDRDIHSANPLSRRHDRLPLSPFFNHHDDNVSDDADAAPPPPPPPTATAAAISKLFGDDYYSDSDEAEAASWLLSNTKHSEDEPKSIDYLFGDTDTHVGSFMDLVDPPKPDPGVDCVVPDPDPDPNNNNNNNPPEPHSMYSLSSYNHNFNNNANTYETHHHHSHPHPLKHHYHPVSSFAPANQPSLSHSVSSSSLEFGVVPDANAMADVGSKQHIKMMGLDREARVLRYREKRKNRKFEKTIRYASRKAYAETRPRIKGRFAKRTDVDPAASVDGLFSSDPGYGVVPSF